MNPFQSLNCKEDSEYKGLYYHKDLPFEMYEEDGYITLSVNLEYTISKGKIPYTEEALRNLIKTFNPNA